MYILDMKLPNFWVVFFKNKNINSIRCFLSFKGDDVNRSRQSWTNSDLLGSLQYTRPGNRAAFDILPRFRDCCDN